MKIKLKKPLRFQDIPRFTKAPAVTFTVAWQYLKNQIEMEEQFGDGIDFDPDFQRGHVWTQDKQQAYVEFVLRGGQSSQHLYFNCPNYRLNGAKDYVLVDGKQRLTAVLKFLNDELPIFGGHVYSEFTDSLRMTDARFTWNINDLATRAEVLQWYLDLNTGGVVHSPEEIERVQQLLKAETKN